MNRRASLPGADELFRPTGGAVRPLRSESPRRAPPADEGSRRSKGAASGRTSHDAKITVYLTEQELLDLEQARLRLRAEFNIGVDRGRLVREAVADVLADLEASGADARIVRRLT